MDTIRWIYLKSHFCCLCTIVALIRLLSLCRAHLERRAEAIEDHITHIDPVSEPAPSAVTLACSVPTAFGAALEPEDIVEMSVETLSAPDSDDLRDGFDEFSTIQLRCGRG